MPSPIVAPPAEMATGVSFPTTGSQSSSNKKTKKRKKQRKKQKKQQLQQLAGPSGGGGCDRDSASNVSAFGTARPMAAATDARAAAVKGGSRRRGGGSETPGDGDHQGSSDSSDSSTTSRTGSSPGGGATVVDTAAAGAGRDRLRLGNPEDVAILDSVGLGPNQKEHVRTVVLPVERGGVAYQRFILGRVEAVGFADKGLNNASLLFSPSRMCCW